MPIRNVSRFLSAATVVLAVTASATAVAAGDAEFENAYQLFASASSGRSSAVDKAADAFESLRRAEPGNPVVLAYAGASTALKATTTMLPWKKMSYAEDGLAQLDKALAMLAPPHDLPLQHHVPGSLEVKFIAANTFLAVPSFMHRGARGAKLLEQVLASPLFMTAPLPFKGQVWMRAAKLATAEHRPADARRHLDAVIASGAPQAAAAKSRLGEVAP
jgi:hypothetical protein